MLTNLTNARLDMIVLGVGLYVGLGLFMSRMSGSQPCSRIPDTGVP